MIDMWMDVERMAGLQSTEGWREGSLTFLHPSLVHPILPPKLNPELLLVLERLIQGEGMQRRAHNITPLHLQHQVGTDGIHSSHQSVVHLFFDFSVAKGGREGGREGGMGL